MNDLFSVLKKNNYFVTFFFLAVCTLVAFLFAHVIPGNSPNIALVYILGLILIARHTDGYRYGIFAALFCVISINYFFTYPYFKLNFTLSGYPVTFIGMLTITIITSATTTRLKKQALLISEREKVLVEADKENEHYRSRFFLYRELEPSDRRRENRTCHTDQRRCELAFKYGRKSSDRHTDTER